MFPTRVFFFVFDTRPHRLDFSSALFFPTLGMVIVVFGRPNPCMLVIIISTLFMSYDIKHFGLNVREDFNIRRQF